MLDVESGCKVVDGEWGGTEEAEQHLLVIGTELNAGHWEHPIGKSKDLLIIHYQLPTLVRGVQKHRHPS